MQISDFKKIFNYSALYQSDQGQKVIKKQFKLFFSNFEFLRILSLTCSEMNTVAAVQNKSKSNIKIKKPKRDQIKFYMSMHILCFRLEYELSYLKQCSFNMQG